MKWQNKKVGLTSQRYRLISSFCLCLLIFFCNTPWNSVQATQPPFDPDFPQNPLQFERITVEDGLSNDTVQAILQTRDGLMWFGTKNGLNQYNGYDFEIFKSGDDLADSLQNDHINSLLEDSRGGLWIGTDQGLDFYQPELKTFLHYISDPAVPGSLSGNEISGLVQDANQTLWVGTKGNGLNRLDAQAANFKSYRHNSSNPHSINGDTIIAIQIDSKGKLWIATENGLNFYDSVLDQFESVVLEGEDSLPNPSGKITALAIDDQDGLWLGTRGLGLVYYNQKTKSVIHYQTDDASSDGIASNGVLSLQVDSKNDLWIGMDNGLDQYHPATGLFSHLQNAPPSSFWVESAAVHCMYQDRNGILWIASEFGGVSKYDPAIERFTLLQAQKNNPQSLSGNDVTGITETKDGVVWISTYGEGISLYDRKARQFSTLRHLPSDPTSLSSDTIRTLIQSSNESIWVGTVENGLDRYRPSTKIFTHFVNQPNVQTSLSENNITAILEDHAGRIWVGTYSKGLNLALPGDQGFTRYQHEAGNPNSILDDHILALYEDQQHNIWIGTWNGITRFSPDTEVYRHFQKDINDPDSLTSNMVFSFYQGEEDSLWIGTNGGGVNRLDLKTMKFNPFKDPEGVLDTVYAIIPAPDDSLWFSTNKGIVHYDPYQNSIRIYDERDGLQANNFNPGAAYKNAIGEIFFGGSNGLNIFQPQKIYPSSYVAPIALLTIKSGSEVLYRNVSVPVQVVLPSNASNLSFEFAVLDYSDAEKNVYAYQLVGYDKDWIFAKPGRRYSNQNSIKDIGREWSYVSARRLVNYEGLPDGKYTFRVKGTNNDLIWTNDVLSVGITVKPPFWKTAWFPIGLIVMSVGLIFVGNLYRTRRIAEVNQVLEHQVKERTFEIQQKQEVADGLRDILAYINSDQLLEKILGHLGVRSLRLMGADGCVVMQYDESIVIAEGRAGFDLEMLKQLEGDPLQLLHKLFSFENEREPVLINNLQKFIRQKMAAKQPEAINWHTWQLEMGILFHGLIVVPIMVRGGKVAGKLLYFYVNANPLMKKQAELSELGIIFADQAALAIENALLREHAEINAVTAERNRIARDLHDAVTQTLFSASLVAEVLPRVYAANESDGSEMLNDLQLMTRGALAEMRTLLIELRPTSFDEMPICDLIRQLAESFISKLDVPVDVSIEGSVILPALVQTAVFRIAQESLNNIQKHGMAKHVQVNLNYNAQFLVLRILDDGCGFDCEEVTGGHLGLKIMCERAQSIGAKLEIESKINQGTMILLDWKPQED